MARRNSVRKGPSARKFRKQSSKTNIKNVKALPMRGGIRL